MFSSAPSHLQRIRELTSHMYNEECDIVRFFEICPDMLCIVDHNGTILQINSAWQEMLGWSETDLVNRSILDFVHPNDTSEMGRILRSIRESQIVRFMAKLKVNRSKAPSTHCNAAQKTSAHFLASAVCNITSSEDTYLPIEWVATQSSDGNVYMSAREIPELCVDCIRARLVKPG